MNLVIAPDPILKKKSLMVDAVDDQIRGLMDDMLETMRHEEGIGLAAVQVGVLKRVIVIDLANENEDSHPLFMANPEILIFLPQTSVYNEGCLSFPEQRLEIERASGIAVSYLDYHNKYHEITVEGLLATAIQHEIDHINGILISDHASKLKQEMMLKKSKKIKNKR